MFSARRLRRSLRQKNADSANESVEIVTTPRPFVRSSCVEANGNALFRALTESTVANALTAMVHQLLLVLQRSYAVEAVRPLKLAVAACNSIRVLKLGGDFTHRDRREQ